MTTQSLNEWEIEKMDDQELIEYARTGNRDAFGELVRRYRSQAIHWAQKFASDTHMAEDIVQEALIKAFLHMGTLIDVNRFSPWFKKIVQNQALMKLRQTNAYQREQLFTHIENKYSYGKAFDVYNIDHILHHLTQSISNDLQHQQMNPEVLLLKKEMLEGIRDLLFCLSNKERQVFEAYFFDQITPSEIADLFGVSIGNIYTTLSRTRTKVKKERTRLYLNGYFKLQINKGITKRKILNKPIL
ncbi:RNA polymerase sigma factor [Bacillaceae bacterium W0354]